MGMLFITIYAMSTLDSMALKNVVTWDGKYGINKVIRCHYLGTMMSLWRRDRPTDIAIPKATLLARLKESIYFQLTWVESPTTISNLMLIWMLIQSIISCLWYEHTCPHSCRRHTVFQCVVERVPNFFRSHVICQRGCCESTVTSWYLENTRGRGCGCSLYNFLSFSRHINMPVTKRQPFSSVMGFRNRYNQTGKVSGSAFWSIIRKGEIRFTHLFQDAYVVFLLRINANRKSPKNCHSVNCTYYANMLHLNCNHNRQGPSGSDDRCQPLIINVSSEKSAVPAAQPHSGLDFSSRHKPTFIFSLVACNHCVKLCCQRVIFQNDFWLMIPVMKVFKEIVTRRCL